MLGGDDFREAFLQANANEDFVAGEVEDLLRMLMRSTASQDPSANIYRAIEKLTFILQLLKRNGKINLYSVLDQAVHAIAGRGEADSGDNEILDAAKDGVMLLVESTASDYAAKGRASKRRSQFLRSLEYIEAARKARRGSW